MRRWCTSTHTCMTHITSTCTARMIRPGSRMFMPTAMLRWCTGIRTTPTCTIGMRIDRFRTGRTRQDEHSWISVTVWTSAILGSGSLGMAHGAVLEVMHAMGLGEALVHGDRKAGKSPTTHAASGGANGNRLRGPDHAIEHLDREGDLALLGGQAASPELRTDDRLVAPDGRLRERTSAVLRRFLPGHAALHCDNLNVAIALALRISLFRARHRRCTRGDDNLGRRIGLMACHSLVDGITIIRAVRYDTRNLA